MSSKDSPDMPPFEKIRWLSEQGAILLRSSVEGMTVVKAHDSNGMFRLLPLARIEQRAKHSDPCA